MGQKREHSKGFDLYMNSEERAKLRILADSRGLGMSAYLRTLIHDQWNASPHLWEKMRGGEDKTE